MLVYLLFNHTCIENVWNTYAAGTLGPQLSQISTSQGPTGTLLAGSAFHWAGASNVVSCHLHHEETATVLDLHLLCIQMLFV